MRSSVTAFFLISFFLFGCRGEPVVPDSEPDETPTMSLVSKLKLLDSQEVIKGADFIQSFPDAKFERYTISMAISGLVIDEWRIDDQMSLFLFPTPKAWTSPWEEKNTGVTLEVTSPEGRYSEPYLPSKEPTDDYFGPTSNLTGKGLDPEADYLQFALIRRSSDFSEDLVGEHIYSSRSIRQQ